MAEVEEEQEEENPFMFGGLISSSDEGDDSGLDDDGQLDGNMRAYAGRRDVDNVMDKLRGSATMKDSIFWVSVIATMATAKENTDGFRNAGVVSMLVDMLDVSNSSSEDQLSLAAKAAYTLRNLVCGNHHNRERAREDGCIPPLVQLLTVTDTVIGASECATAASGALRNLSHQNVSNRQAIREAGGLKALVACVGDPPPAQGMPGRETSFRAAATICNLCVGCPDTVAELWQTGMVKPLLGILCNDNGTGLWHPGFVALLDYGETTEGAPQQLRDQAIDLSRSIQARKDSRQAVRKLQTMDLSKPADRSQKKQTTFDPVLHKWVPYVEPDRSESAKTLRRRQHAESNQPP